ncbi:DOCKER domain-containing protein [Aphelenchoides fujianensis]|nr:DOCKER domain-containing protein [Aphelenchoides fujianensis]
MGFAVGFAPRLVRCLNAGAEQPKKRRRLLVAAITLLTEIILEVKPLIENPEKVQKMRPKFFKLVNCCFGSVIDCHLSGLYSNSEEIAVRSQYLFALFLESIDAQCFAQFLTRLPPTADIHTVLHQTILGLRSMTEPSSKRSFNEPAMRWMFNRLIVKFFRFITALFDDHRTLHFTSIALWKEFLICIHSFLLNTHKEDAFSLFDELNELPRLQAADCLRALWFMIPKSKWASVLGNMLETTIDVLFGGCNQQIRAVLMPLFGQLAFVACADEETGNAGAEVDFYKILYHRLSSRKTKQRKQQVPTLISEMVDEIQELVESGNELYKYNRFCLMPRFIGLVECGKQALMKKHTYQYETVYCELMAFCSSIGEHALSAELNVKFFSFQTDRKHFTEAACGLQNFAKNLSWTAFAPLKQESLFLAKRLALDCTTESELKAELTRKFVALFEREQCWELAVAPLGELADFYANIRPNAKLLAEISEQKRKLERSIETCVRVECHYYLLRFFGLRFPVHLQNREYVMRGLAGELLDNFRQRLIREFGCELIKDAHVNESEWSQRRGKFVQIVAVTPVPGKKHQPLSEVKNPLLSWFYTHNAVQAFDSFRPAMRKETKWTKVAANDSTKFWLQRTRYHLIRELPNVLSFGEVIQRVVGEDLNPVQTATRTIVEANEKLEFLTKMVDCGFKNTHLSALSGHVRGILQAFVGGGIQNYKIFFSPQMREVLDEQERPQVEELKQMLVKQVQLLLVALKTHEKSVGAESRPLHDTLVSSFQGFKAMVEEMCKQDAPPTPSSSGQPKAVAKK